MSKFTVDSQAGTITLTETNTTLELACKHDGSYVRWIEGPQGAELPNTPKSIGRIPGQLLDGKLKSLAVVVTPDADDSALHAAEFAAARRLKSYLNTPKKVDEVHKRVSLLKSALNPKYYSLSEAEGNAIVEATAGISAEIAEAVDACVKGTTAVERKSFTF